MQVIHNPRYLLEVGTKLSSNYMERKPFDLLGELGKFGLEHGIFINDPQAIAEFATFVGDAMEGALLDPALLYGQRTEAMFEAMLVSLGRYSLLTAEDGGRVHSDGNYQAPDFRVVLPGGAQWLIEVKNVYIEDPSRQERQFMTRAYREKLENYAYATGGQLKLAVYWARWGIWTLVSPERLLDVEGNLTLDLATGIRLNELSQLGDRMVGTRPPLRFRLETDPATTESIAPDGTVRFTISGVRFYSGEEELSDTIDKELAWIFMQYGEWEETGPEAIIDGDLLTAIEFRWEPEQRLNKGYEIIGTLSQMFSRYYSERTLKDAEVVQLHAPLRPGWFAPLVTLEYQKKVLPLWIFQLEPAD